MTQILAYADEQGQVYAKDQSGEEGVWRTMRGRKVFIREGETAIEAFKRTIPQGKWKTDKGQVIAFHGTTESVLEKIRKAGIKVTGKRSFRDKTLYADVRGRSVFVTSTKNEATWYARQHVNSIPVTLELRIPRSEFTKFQRDTEHSGRGAAFAPIHIKPKWIYGAEEYDHSTGYTRLFVDVQNDLNGTMYVVILVETPLTLNDTGRSLVSAPVNGYGRVLAYADADGRVYAEWDESKHPRDDQGQFKLALRGYAFGADYIEMNRLLRAGVRPPPTIQKKIRILDAAIANTPPLGKEIVVFRGAGYAAPELKVGQVYVEKGFMSTSLNSFSAARFGRGNVWKIKLPEGTHAARIRGRGPASYVGEKERLLGRGARLHVTSVDSLGATLELIGVGSVGKFSQGVEVYSIRNSLYVHRPVLNAEEIITWANAQGFTTTLPAEAMHVTIAFSREPVDWLEFDHSVEELELPGDGFRVVEYHLPGGHDQESHGGEFAPKDFPKGMNLYHGTAEEAVGSIAKHGIVPKFGPGASAWRDQLPGWDNTVQADIGERAVSVYL